MYSFETNRKGFGLIEVMIAVGLLGIMAVGITSMLTNANKQQRGLMAQDQLRDVGLEIATLLSNPGACLQSLNSGGAQVATANFSLTTLKDASGTDKFTAGSKDKSGLLSYASYDFKSFALDAGSLTTGMATLTFYMAKVGETLSVPTIHKDLTLRVNVNAGNVITGCFYIANVADTLWQLSASIPGAIYYNGGNVGIGTSTPATPLDVLGDVSVRNNAGSNSTITMNASGGGRANIIYFQQAGGLKRFSLVGSNGNAGTDDFTIGYYNNAGAFQGNPFQITRATGEVVAQSMTASTTGVSVTGNVSMTGNLTTGGTASTGGALTVNGNGTINGNLTVTGGITANTVTTPSDETLKKDIVTLKNSLNLVTQLRGVNFIWKSNDQKDIGFIAQEVRKVVPEFVVENQEGLLSVKYSNMSALLVEAIKEMQRERESDRRQFAKRIQELEKQIESLKKNQQQKSK